MNKYINNSKSQISFCHGQDLQKQLPNARHSETFKDPASEPGFHRTCQQLSTSADQANYLIIKIKLRGQHFKSELKYKCHFS